MKSIKEQGGFVQEKLLRGHLNLQWDILMKKAVHLLCNSCRKKKENRHISPTFLEFYFHIISFWAGGKKLWNSSTYFLTKDTKLCKSFFFYFNAHSYFFFYFLLHIIFLLLFSMFCMICNQTTFLPHVFIQHSHNMHSLVCERLCSWKNGAERKIRK